MTNPNSSTLAYFACISSFRPASCAVGCCDADPFIFRYTGLSGMKKLISRNRAAGSVSAQNIHRQPHSTFHACSGIMVVSRANTMLTTCAERIPSTIVIWLRLTMRPRISAGLTSAIYIGASAEATPMPMPPTKRATLNKVKSLNKPVPTADSVKSMADTIRSGLRPYLSAAAPATIAPTRQPIKAVVMAMPCIRGESLIPKNSS